MMKQALALLAISAALPACQFGTHELHKIAGHYEGSLIDRTGGQYRQTPVSLDLPVDETALKSVTLKDLAGKKAADLRITDVRGSSVTLELAPLLPAPVRLQLKNGCFTGSGAQLCASDDALSFDFTGTQKVPVVSIYLQRFPVNHAASPSPSEARSFTLSEAVAAAMKKSFDTRIEFEHVMQAKHTARAGWLNLLPKVSFNTVIALATMDRNGLLGALGDLAPFLFPTRWLTADIAKNQEEAEKDTLILMRLSAGQQVEGLAYVYARDQAIVSLVAATLDKAYRVREEIRVREQLGQYPPGSTDNMDSIVNSMEQNLEALQLLVKEEKPALAQALGFEDPAALVDLALDTETVPIEAAPQLDSGAVTEDALGRSFELRQLDYLIHVARLNKQMKYWNWLDPSGDYTMNLGFQLYDQVAVSKSQIQELEIKREQLKSGISLTAYDAVADHEGALAAYAKAKEGTEIQERRLTRVMESIQIGAKVDLFGLVSIFQDYLTAGIARETVIANYRVSRSRVDRLLLQGYYAHPTAQ